MSTWAGKLLKADLSSRTFEVIGLERGELEKFLGGRGLGARLLRSFGRHLCDPFDESAPLILTASPLSATKAPSSSRTSLTAISPLTNTVFESNSGGRAGEYLRRAGFDALFIEGVSSSPLRLDIGPGDPRFIDASSLWGLGNGAAREALKRENGKAACITIGQAGENGSLIANVCNDGRFFGRGGLGALFGAKKLKAITIFGEGEVFPADPEGFEFIVDECKKLLSAHPITSKGLPQFGTAVLMNVMNSVEALPTGNYRAGRFEGAERISGEAIRDNILTGRHGCPGCQIVCGRRVTVDGEESEGPEFETLWAFGAALGLDDLSGIVRLNRLSNDLGLDTISAGSTIAAARELYEEGRLGWNPLEGGTEGIGELLAQMAKGEGRGAVLRDGSRELCDHSGAPWASIAVKGLELPAYDPRGCQGQGLSYATSSRGGCHLRAYMVAPEILAVPKLVDRFATSGKAGLVIVSQNLNSAVDSIGMCRFTSFALKDDYYARLLSSVSGMEIDAQGLMTAGERIYNLERLINVERGFRRSDDTLPQRLLSEPLAEGPSAGKVVELKAMLDEYYRFRGWDAEGRPTPQKLRSLGLAGSETEAG
ncbi:aldehyde ferredoxin oxidoreductase [bacterium]|nr:MAG: aldehyde ferredoxin oxidoreductase [bacterium]